MFDNELTWFFIVMGAAACFGLHSCTKVDQQEQMTRQVEIRAKADLEIARMAASNRVSAASQPEAER